MFGPPLASRSKQVSSSHGKGYGGAGSTDAGRGLESSVRAQLEVIEAALLEASEADSDMVTEAARHIIAAGGKRFRPLLVVLGSHIGPYAEADDVVKAAVVVELTHGQPHHDDVMDEAPYAEVSERQLTLGKHRGHPGR